GLGGGGGSPAIIRKEAEAPHSDHHNGRHGPRSRRCGQSRIAPHNGMKAVRWHGLKKLEAVSWHKVFNQPAEQYPGRCVPLKESPHSRKVVRRSKAAVVVRL